jgi:putative Holliday junction resolvase
VKDGGRTLAVDLGDVRVGLALSDPLGISAQPLESLPRVGPRKDLERIARLVEDAGVSTVVVGLPLLMSGEEGPRALAAREFAERLGRRLRGVGVELWDERLTTVQAERALISSNVRRGKRRSVVDAAAAILILQNWLDARSSAGGARR